MDAIAPESAIDQRDGVTEFRSAVLPTWAVVSTIKETQRDTENFIAHYLSLGAHEIHIYFDDPDDVSIPHASAIDRVNATQCSLEYWEGIRPDRHEWRQKANARHAYRQTTCDWIIHLDADEFIYCPNGVPQLLAGLAAHDNAARVIPAEPLIHPRSGRIKAYHSPLPGNTRGKRLGEEAFGEIYPLLTYGMLSHAEGKFFLRTRLPDDPISIHRPRVSKGVKIATLAKENILLLHHHGHVEDTWIEKFSQRINTTYSAHFRDNKRKSGRLDGKGLNGYLTEIAQDGEDALRTFFRQTHHIDHSVEALRKANALHRPQIWLDQKRDDLFDGPRQICSDFKVNPASGRLQARAEFCGIKMIVEPDFNRMEQSLALGKIEEEKELSFLKQLVSNKTVRFWDIGANAGVYSLIIAASANADSDIKAFEPHPRLIEAIHRNIAANEFKNVSVVPVAIGSIAGTAPLHIAQNLGKSSLIPKRNSEQIEVQVEKLIDYAKNVSVQDLSILKISVEGAEPEALKNFLEVAPAASFPDYILYHHAYEKSWSTRANELFSNEIYTLEHTFKFNTLLRKSTRPHLAEL